MSTQPPVALPFLSPRRVWVTGACSVALAIAVAGQAPPLPDGGATADPFAFFHPPVTIAAADRARIARGETVVKSVAPADGQVAIFSAARTTVNGDRLVRWVHRIDAMKRGKYVPVVVRFSDPPRPEDLTLLELDADDLEALRHCRPGSCALKLSEREMQQLVPLAAARAAGWQQEVQRAFRATLLARARDYVASGFAQTPPYRDHDRPVRLDEEFDSLLAQSPFLTARLPALVTFFRRYPHARATGVDSFLYWSKEILGRKPVISITHVTITRPGGADAIVVSRQVYATHYMSGSLAVTAIVGDGDGTSSYLAYLNRSRVDVLDGFFGGLVRRIVERRLRDEAGQVVDGLRRRLEGGDPP